MTGFYIGIYREISGMKWANKSPIPPAFRVSARSNTWLLVEALRYQFAQKNGV